MNTICIKKSKLYGSGEGVYLKVDVPSGRTVAFYNGVHKTELELVSTVQYKNPIVENEFEPAQIKCYHRIQAIG